MWDACEYSSSVSSICFFHFILAAINFNQIVHYSIKTNQFKRINGSNHNILLCILIKSIWNRWKQIHFANVMDRPWIILRSFQRCTIPRTLNGTIHKSGNSNENIGIQKKVARATQNPSKSEAIKMSHDSSITTWFVRKKN